MLKTNIDFEVDIPVESARWISVEPYTKALNTKYVELIVAGNDGYARTGKVHVVNKKSGVSAVVTINQEAAIPAGARNGSSVAGQNSDGNYWSSSVKVVQCKYAYCVWLSSSDIYTNIPYDRNLGCSVRLVTDVK